MIKELKSSKGRTITVLKCQQCGAPLNVITNSQLIKCESCGTINKLPEVGNLKIEVSSKDDVYEMSSAEQMLSNLYDEAIIWKQKGYYQRSLEKFSEIKAYRDSAQQIEELEITIDNEEKYQKAIEYIKQKLYKDAMVLLKEISSYKNADELYENCKRLIEAKGIKNKEGKNITDYIIIPLVLISIIPFIIGLSIIISSFIPKEENITGSIDENKSALCRRYFYEGWYSQVYALDENFVGFSNKKVVFTEKSAGFEAFKFKNLKLAVIESDVENLPSFYLCLNLQTIEFKNESKVKKIKSLTFDRCEKLTSIVIPDRVKEIKTWAFYNCFNLRTVIIPASVEVIEKFAFNSCNKITIYAEPEEKPEGWAEQFVIEANNTPCVYWYSETYKENCWRYVDGEPKVWEKYESATEEKTVEETEEKIIEENEEIIWKNAFTLPNYNTMEASVRKQPRTLSGYVIIPNEVAEISYGKEYIFKVTYIEEEAFKDLTEIKKIFIKSGIKIKDRAFWGCTCEIEFEEPSSITQTDRIFAGYKGKCLNLPKSITSISEYAFSSCDNIGVSGDHEKYQELWDHGIMIDSFKEITISKNITNIGYCAFFGCKDLKDIWYEGTKQEWNNIIKAKGWNYNTPDFIIHCTDGIIRKPIEKGD